MNHALTSYETTLASARPMTGQLQLNVCLDINMVKQQWQSLERDCCATAFQSFVWCETWLRTVGQVRKIEPVIVVGLDSFGRVAFILPFQRRVTRFAVIIEALTAPQGSYAFGLFSKGFLASDAALWFQQHFNDLLAALPQHDVLHLANLPDSIENYPNPLLQQPYFRAANQSHIMHLQHDFKALFEARRSAESRRAMRKRDAKLLAFGDLEFCLPTTKQDRQFTLETMFEHQKARLAEVGVHDVFDDTERNFILDLADLKTGEEHFLRPYSLTLDGKIQSVMLGAYFNNTYWAMITSMGGGDMRKHSPGDYALRQLIKSLCDDQTMALDFGSGDSAYKAHWSDRQIPLYFIVRANSFKGLFPAAALMLREKLKGFVKRSTQLKQAFVTARRLLRGRSASH